MAYKVRTEFWPAYSLVTSRGVSFFDTPTKETLEPMVAAILVREKGYPENTVVLIDAAWDEVDMTLVVEPDGSWELV